MDFVVLPTIDGLKQSRTFILYRYETKGQGKKLISYVCGKA